MLQLNKKLLFFGLGWAALLAILVYDKNRTITRLNEELEQANKESARLSRIKDNGFVVPQHLKNQEQVGLWPVDIESAVYLLVFKPDCYYCDQAAQTWDSLSGELSRLGIRTVGVSTKAERLGDFVSNHHLTFPILVDPNGDQSEEFGVVEYPSQLLIGRRGQILARGIECKRLLGDWKGGHDSTATQSFIQTITRGIYGPDARVEEIHAKNSQRVFWTIWKEKEFVGSCSFGFDSGTLTATAPTRARVLAFFDSASVLRELVSLDQLSLYELNEANSENLIPNIRPLLTAAADARLCWE